MADSKLYTNYITYSILGDIVNQHIENEDEIVHHYLEFVNEKKIVLFEVASAPIIIEVESNV